MENTNIKWLLFLVALAYSVNLLAQETKYQVEYKIIHKGTADTNSEVTIKLGNSTIYNSFIQGTAQNSTLEDIQEFKDIITLSNPTTSMVMTGRSTGSCPEDYTVPFAGFDGCWNDLSDEGSGFGCFVIENEYFRVTDISSEESSLDSLNSEKSIEYCEPQKMYTPFCGDGSYSLDIIIDGGNRQNLLTYGVHPWFYNFNPSTITGVTENSVIKIEIFYTEDKSESDIITYTVNPCPLKLDTTVNPNPASKNVTCNGGSDGGFTVTFDRELTNTEYLEISFIRDNNNDGNFEEEPYDTSGQLFADDFTNRSYTYTGLSVGNYEIEWNQGLIAGGSLIPGGTATFQVTEPDPLGYSLTVPVQDVTCTLDGEINISPSGGSGNYKYQWMGPNGATTIVSTSQNLSTSVPGDYVLRLFDANVIDDSCFIDSSPINIGEPPAKPEINLTSLEQPSSSNGGKGSISVQITGTEPFTYEWQKDGSSFTPLSPSTNLNLVNLDPGTYTLTVTDSNGCTSILPPAEYILDPLPVLDVTIEQASPIRCEGDTTILTALGQGGAGDYSYSWSTGATTETITAGPGDYSVTVTDLSGNTAASDIMDITYVDGSGNVIPNVLNVTVTDITDIECKGENNGRIALDISGGTGNFEVFWDGSLTPGPQDNNTLSYGNHTYEVFDGNCSVSGGPIFIDEPDDYFLVSASSTDATTNGGDEGTITLNITGGSGNYTYAWYKDGSAFSPINGATANEFEGFPTGNYQVIVSETNGTGCTATLENTVFIDEPGPLSLGTPEAIVDPILCFGDSTGRISANYTGTPPFEFVWYNVDTGMELKRSEEDFLENINVGNYSFTINDASNAGPISSGTIELPGPLAALSATALSTPISCFGNSDGTITINANGGTGSLRYQITGKPLQNNPFFENLASGTYSATVIDQNGCTYNVPDAIEIIEPDLIQIDDFLVTPATFSGAADGQISIDVSGGTTPYTYSWTGPGITIPRTTKDIDALTTGNYTVVITSPGNQGGIDGCYLTQTFFVSEPGPLNLPDLSSTNISCSGANDGAITSAAQGTGTIDYVWEKNGVVIDGQIGPDLTDLGPGTYTLTVSDETSNPSVTKSVTLTEPTPLTAQAFPTDVTCFGVEDGSVVITPDGGTLSYNYSIDGGINYQSGNSFSGLAAGNHSVRVQDANLCTVDVDFVISEPQPIAITLDLQQSLSAANATDGAISITAFGGTGALTYTWTGPTGFTPPTDNSDDITDLPGGTYTLVITDDNFNGDLTTGCYFTQDFTITEPGELLVSLAQTVFLECNGNDFAEITATVQGGVSPYSLEWFDTTDGSDDLLSETSEIIGGLTAGTYFVRVTDANGIIKDSDPITVTEPDLLEITLENTTNILCNGEETGAIDISVSGGTIPYEFYWSNGANTEDITDLAVGEYTIEVVDANSCSTDMTITISAPDNPLEISNVTLTNASEYEAMDGRIVLEVSGGQPGYNMSWTRASDGAIIGNTSELLNLGADTYTVVITDNNSCSVTETYQITEPDIVEETLVQPICSGESNGSISLLVNQGNGNYSYSWSTGDTTNSIDNLAAGEYSVTITGLPNGTIERIYLLENPLPLNVDLGDNRVLCAEQELILDATVEDATATYSWYSDNGFISAEPFITVDEKGNYTVTVQSATGCTATGSISIDKSTDEISAELAVSSQVFVGETAILVDISYPLPETTEWILPEGAQVLLQDNDEAEIVFAETGEYEVGILTKIGECMAEQTKTIIVVANDPTIEEADSNNGQRLVEEFMVYPNPTDGKFTAEVDLTERGNISIKVFGLANNALMASEKGQGQTAYSIPFDISGLPSGVYAVLLETPYGNSLRKIIVR
ncbi:T9SS type A sorting domain-containing protein [Maribacter polysaccharolyticus]|uniref:T9SS type A sorting domain-containing protein n=1 Tax=Maribacter polysaccharolyticus TaxID=3020831 RepID=UPI00237F1B6B|nr:T9SS type A sorting domain-containing protein [Maribacter polysaccharolyticus]MDE3743069.1 T9SS type A sorting domain-containing protein [Maribacter polysaccharolyticus]